MVFFPAVIPLFGVERGADDSERKLRVSSYRLGSAFFYNGVLVPIAVPFPLLLFLSGFLFIFQTLPDGTFRPLGRNSRLWNFTCFEKHILKFFQTILTVFQLIPGFLARNQQIAVFGKVRREKHFQPL